jgi:hypothetical protein
MYFSISRESYATHQQVTSEPVQRTHLQAVIHVRCLLKSSSTLETIGFFGVLGPCYPTDVVVRIEGDSLLSLFFADQLQSIIMNEDR